jgi:hypothetical protein
MALPLEKWAERYAYAWEAADDEAAGALFTDDATYRPNPFEEPYRGRDEIRRYWREVTAKQARVDVRIGWTVAHGARGVVEWWTEMDSEGTSVTLPGALLLDFDENGLCKALREYWNLEVGRRIHPPEGWGT